MQRPDDAKRKAIMKTAVRMFSRRPFHEVRLDDIAAAARIGKGTVYIYFKSKEDLYDSLVLGGLSDIVTRLEAISKCENGDSEWAVLERMVVELSGWAHTNPHIFQMIREATSDQVRPRLSQKRKALGYAFEAVLRRAVKNGEINDPNPALTAQMIPACVRGAIRWGPRRISAKVLSAHVLMLLRGGIGVRGIGRGA